MQEFIHTIGKGLCHQIPARTFEAGGILYPVCARDTGIYLGLVASLVVLLILYRRRPDSGFPALPAIVVSALLLFTMAIDGVSSYAGWRETTNIMRFFTGCAAGTCGGMFLFWVLRSYKGGDDSKKVLASPRDLSTWLVVSALIYIVFYLAFPYLGGGGALFITLLIILVVSGLNFILISLFKPFEGFWTSAKVTIVLCCISLVSGIIELLALGAGKTLLWTFLNIPIN